MDIDRYQYDFIHMFVGTAHGSVSKENYLIMAGMVSTTFSMALYMWHIKEILAKLHSAVAIFSLLETHFVVFLCNKLT